MNVLVRVGRETKRSRGPRPPPRWGIPGRDPVAKTFRWETACTGMVGCSAWAYLGLNTLRALPVCVALADSEG